jgi:HK97 family phage major capsid protein
MNDINEVIALCNEQAEQFKSYRQRLESMEKRERDAAKKLNRPGAPGDAMNLEDTPEPEGFITLGAAHLRSREAIAARLGIKQECGEESVRIGEFMRAAAGMKTERKGLIEGTDTSGGYTVPDVLLPGILAALAPASSMLQAGANIVKLNEPAASFRVPGISSIPTPEWRAERGNIAESDPAFRAISIMPKSLAFYFKVSRELLQDSPGLDAALNTVIGQAFAKAIDRAGLLGSGAGNEPIGLANTPGVNVISLGTNGAALTSFSPFVKAMTAIKSADAPTPTAAIMAPRTSGDIAELVDTTGQPLRKPDSITALKFLDSSQVPVDDTVGTSDDCSRLFIGDFTNFSFYMREGLSVQLLKELFATTGEVAFICHARVDVAALYAKAFTLVNGVRPAA